jgi:pantothenate kinase
VPEAELRARLAARWSGYGLRPEEVTAKLEENDLPNGRFVVANSVASEFTIANV